MQEVLDSLKRSLPEAVLTIGLLLVVIVDSTLQRWRHVAGRFLTIVSLAAALGLAVQPAGPAAAIWKGMLATDPMAAFFKALLIGASLLVVLPFSFRNSRELHGLGQGEFHALLLALTLSNVLMAASNDITMLYLSLEMVSVTSYVMVAYLKGDRLSNEASLKYLLFGAVSTGAMLYGLSLLYGMAGTTDLGGIRQFLMTGVTESNRLAVYVVALLVMAGFGFKTASVPFHFWCPDAYQGAPTPVTALLSVAPKAAGFAVMVRFFFQGMSVPGADGWALIPIQGLPDAALDWPAILMVVSALTMTVGNVAALTQTNLKRLLAYSSIAHAGYVLMGVVALSPNGARGVMVYLLAYLFMNLGAFLVVTLIHLHDGSFELHDYAGLYQRAPFLTGAMAVFLLSLTGIPPMVGFLGKLYVFAAVIERGYVAFAVIGAVNAAIAAYYYFRILKTMVLDDAEPAELKPALRLAGADSAWLAFFLAGNVAPILWWGTVEGWARTSATLWAGR